MSHILNMIFGKKKRFSKKNEIVKTTWNSYIRQSLGKRRHQFLISQTLGTLPQSLSRIPNRRIKRRKRARKSRKKIKENESVPTFKEAPMERAICILSRTCLCPRWLPVSWWCPGCPQFRGNVPVDSQFRGDDPDDSQFLGDVPDNSQFRGDVTVDSKFRWGCPRWLPVPWWCPLPWSKRLPLTLSVSKRVLPLPLWEPRRLPSLY